MGNNSYIEIPIMHVAHRCGIQLDSKTLDRLEVQGYCPFCNARHNHLYLNTDENKWFCQKCGEGGNSVTLFAKMFNTNNLTAFKELTQNKLYRLPKKQQRATRIITQNIASVQQRHDVYYDLLVSLDLSKSYKKNLLARGLSDLRIDENMYRSMPSDWQHRRDIAEKLAKTHNLKGVPGFFTTDNRWCLWGKSGILIPFLTKDGYIQGMQIRLDDVSKGKYRWLSSNPEYTDTLGKHVFENGTQAYSWIHVTGDTSKTTVCITEGGLKGDVASFLKDEALFVCVAGINNIEFLTEALSELNVTRVVGCYDMDMYKNENVRNAVARMEELIKVKLGLTYEPYAWNPKYNGIDEFLLYRQNCMVA